MLEKSRPLGGTLVERYADLAPEGVRAAGKRLAQENRVAVIEGTARKVQAIVLDTPVSKVEIARIDGTVHASCPCPLRAKGGLCGHLWATLVKADDKGHLADLRVPGLEWKTGGEGIGTRPEGVSSWKPLLRELADAADRRTDLRRFPEKDAGQLIYSVDPAESQKRGVVILRTLVRRRRKSGSWGSPRPKALDLETIRRVKDPAERQALELLVGAGDPSDFYHAPGCEFQLNASQIKTLLPELCRTGRLFLRSPGSQSGDPEPCAWDEGESWKLRLGLLAEDGHYLLGANLERPGETMDVGEPVLFLEAGLVFTRSRAASYEWSGEFHWINQVRKRGRVVIPKGDLHKFLEEAYGLPGRVDFDLPPEAGIERSRVSPRPCLRLASLEEAPRDLIGARLSFDYAGVPVDRREEPRQIFDAAHRRLTHRDPDAEKAAHAKLSELGFLPLATQDDWPDYEIPLGKLPEAIAGLLGADWQVEGEEGLFRSPGRIKIEVTSAIDWFDVAGGAQYGDRVVPLPQLLAALRSGKRFVKLGDGTVGLLPEDWLRHQGLLLAAGEPEGEVLRFGRSQAVLLDALLESEEEATADETFRRLRQGLKRFEGVEAQDAPPGFQGTLREYQRVGLGWLGFLRRFALGGCLADDMGLGKTIQILAYLEARRQAGRGPSLVVVPRSLLFNWKSEAARFAPELPIVEHWGIDRTQGAAGFQRASVVLTTYGTLRRDVTFLKDVSFDCIVLDEAQAIKNGESNTAKAARLLRGEQRIAMSGTPVENHLGELWSLMEFLNPGLLGRASVFREAVVAGAEARNPARTAPLARALRPFILRRTKEQVAPELPERVLQTIPVDLDPTERRRYDELKRHYQQALLGGTKGIAGGRMPFQVLEALLRLRQAACHPGLIDRKFSSQDSSKLDLLLCRLREVTEEGHKALVFSQFTTFLGIVRGRLDQEKIPYEYLDGQTRDRARRVRRFQEDPSCRIFLVSLKAGGLGLNLTAAEYVFLLDPWWNPAAEAQAIDRTHRIGQTRRVIACRLVARQTVEEKIIELQNTKRDLADAILGEEGRPLANLKREDLELLLS